MTVAITVVAIESVDAAIDQIAQTTLRKVVGQHTLDETLSETDRINLDIGMAALLASVIWRSAFFMRSRGRQANQLMLIVFAAGVLLAVVAVIFGPLVRLALSRQRESLADVSGVELTRNPEGLIKALQKLQTNVQPFAAANPVNRNPQAAQPTGPPTTPLLAMSGEARARPASPQESTVATRSPG